MSVCSIAIAPPYVRGGSREGLVLFTIRAYAQTDSTNDDAAAILGEPGSAGSVLVADYQRAGRGRRERAWIAPPGSSLLATAILPEPVPTRALWAVPLWTALCVADAIEATTGLRVALQWPNDLLLEGAKCCGILCVSRVAGDETFVGCGTGINVVRPSDGSSLADVVPPPAFLSDRAPDVTRGKLLDALLAAYARRLPELAQPRAVARAWETRARLAGTPYRILVDGADAPFECVAQRLDDEGSLVVLVGSEERTVSLADARVLR
jgi:BirA family biotin operon repressor/biotin-[acetyl-CoA-carboxylase] ligase